MYIMTETETASYRVYHYDIAIILYLLMCYQEKYAGHDSNPWRLGLFQTVCLQLKLQTSAVVDSTYQ